MRQAIQQLQRGEELSVKADSQFAKPPPPMQDFFRPPGGPTLQNLSSKLAIGADFRNFPGSRRYVPHHAGNGGTPVTTLKQNESLDDRQRDLDTLRRIFSDDKKD